MTDALEQELRAALAERAAAMHADDASERLQRIDYDGGSRWRHRIPSRLPPWPALGAAAAALVAGIFTFIVLLSSGTTAAYAGWSAVPTTPSAPALAAAKASCKRVGGPLFTRAVAGRLVLTDERGRLSQSCSPPGSTSGFALPTTRAAAAVSAATPWSLGSTRLRGQISWGSQAAAADRPPALRTRARQPTP